VADWYLLLKSPTSSGYQLWTLGDYIANGPVWTEHEITAGRALYGIPDNWSDGDAYPTNTYRCDLLDYHTAVSPRDPVHSATFHAGAPDPDFPHDA
jgi:hypothetical protein